MEMFRMFVQLLIVVKYRILTKYSNKQQTTSTSTSMLSAISKWEHVGNKLTMTPFYGANGHKTDSYDWIFGKKSNDEATRFPSTHTGYVEQSTFR